MSNPKASTNSSRPAVSERDRLARDLYIQLAVSPVSSGRNSGHIAGTAFDMADAFLAEQERRKKA